MTAYRIFNLLDAGWELVFEGDPMVVEPRHENALDFGGRRLDEREDDA